MLQRRLLALWLPSLPVDRLMRRQNDLATRPLAVFTESRGQPVLACVNPPAAAAGLVAGLTLADARARLPALVALPAEAAADRRLLERLADLAERWSPWVALDPPDGLMLDVTGCGPLFGGEAGLAAGLAARLAAAGITARLAVAGTAAAAWALSRFGAAAEIPIVPEGGEARALAALPVAALRLEPAVVTALERLGLSRIGALAAVPRAATTARFGALPWRRLDQALGHLFEPITPRRPVPEALVRRRFAEPVTAPAALAAATRQLCAQLCAQLERQGRGARRLVLSAHRVDGAVQRLAVGTGRPVRDPARLFPLLADRLERLDPGFGIELLALAAPQAQPLAAEQGDLTGQAGGGAALEGLIDRLDNRAGLGRVRGVRPSGSALPERAALPRPPAQPLPAGAGWSEAARRPVRLLRLPIEIEALAPLPDDPPRLLRQGRRAVPVARAEGPERIAPEWWRAGEERLPVRDFYRVELPGGRRLWLSRAGGYQDAAAPPCWRIAGLFG